MPSSKPKSSVHLTVDQFQAEAEAIKQSGLSASEFRRLALQQAIEQQGIAFPDNMPQHGGNRQQTTPMECCWCGHQQQVRNWDSECRNCGECEFKDIN